jgi:hypothetical protein
MNIEHDEIESITPMSDRQHPRAIAMERVAQYYKHFKSTNTSSKPRLTQADIDGVAGESELVLRSAVRFAANGWMRRIKIFLRLI